MFRHKGRTPVIQTFVCAPFPVRVWPCTALAAHRYYDGSDSCPPSPRLTGLPAYLATPSQRCASNHKGGSYVVFLIASQRIRCVSDFAFSQSARRQHPAESSSLYCAPPVRLQLLSTPLRSDAVTFDYRALAYPDTDFHRANVAPSRAH